MDSILVSNSSPWGQLVTTMTLEDLEVCAWFIQAIAESLQNVGDSTLVADLEL